MGAVTDIVMLVGGLRARGAKFAVDDGKIVVEAPAGVITPQHLTILRQRKSEIAALLGLKDVAGKCPGTEVCGGCYEVCPGVHLHPPKQSLTWEAWLQKWQPKEAILQ
jgi:hypothetical protein